MNAIIPFKKDLLEVLQLPSAPSSFGCNAKARLPTLCMGQIIEKQYKIMIKCKLHSLKNKKKCVWGGGGLLNLPFPSLFASKISNSCCACCSSVLGPLRMTLPMTSFTSSKDISPSPSLSSTLIFSPSIWQHEMRTAGSGRQGENNIHVKQINPY
jgi:hypothetical protein